MNRAAMLNAYTDAAKAKRFRPGSHDCALFAANWVKLLTGRDLAAGYRSNYRSLKAGHSAIAAAGFASHIDMAAAALDEVPVAFAQVGDIAVIDENAFGIVSGERVFVLQPDGLATVSLDRATRAFRA